MAVARGGITATAVARASMTAAAVAARMAAILRAPSAQCIVAFTQVLPICALLVGQSINNYARNQSVTITGSYYSLDVVSTLLG